MNTNFDQKGIYFKQIALGPMQNFFYLIGDPETKTAAVFDCAFEPQKIVDIAEQDGYRITDLFLTHVHYDHSATADELQSISHCNVWMNPASSWKEGKRTGHWIIPSDYKPFDMEAKSIQIGSMTGQILATPGHQNDHLSFIIYPPKPSIEGEASGYFISGDALFINGSGRVDLPDSNPEAALETLAHINSLPDDLIVCPGHDYGDVPTDSLGHQKQSNPHLQNPQIRLG